MNGADSKCPVCGSPAEHKRARDYGERLPIDCTRCGQFIITSTALAMIRSRVEANPRLAARVSHAIRGLASDDGWPEIDSTQVDSLALEHLPPVHRQLENLISWIKQQVGDIRLGAVNVENFDALAAIVGAGDRSTLNDLTSWAESEGLIRCERRGKTIRLTPKAWESNVSKEVQPKSPTHQQPARTETGHCPKCGSGRNADVVAEHKQHYEDDDAPVWAIDHYMVLRCRGCDEVYVKRSYAFSEDADYEEDPHTGEYHLELQPEITYWPAPAQRNRPDWLYNLEDATLLNLLEEVYAALDADRRVLAAVGTRTALDRAFVLRGADEADGFAQKLEALQAEALLSEDEKEILLTLTDAGGAAAHRGWRPSPKELETMLSGTEAFLHRALILGSAVKEMKAGVPPKPRRSKK